MCLVPGAGKTSYAPNHTQTNLVMSQSPFLPVSLSFSLYFSGSNVEGHYVGKLTFYFIASPGLWLCKQATMNARHVNVILLESVKDLHDL